MRIALVIENFFPAAGGAERSTAQIATELLRRKHEVTVLCCRTARPDVPEGVEVDECRHNPKHGFGLWSFSRWVRTRLGGGGFDTSLSVTMAAPAHVLQPRGGTIRETLIRTAAARRDPAARALKRALVAATPKYAAQLALERKTLADPLVRRVVAVSGYVADQLRRHYAFDPSRIEVIPNAAVMPQVGRDQRAEWRRAVRSAFGVPDEATAYLFLARNARLKGFDPLIEAVRHLDGRGINAIVFLAGDLEYEHQDAVARLGVRDRVRFVGQTRSVPALYAASDVTVLPTFYDPSSKVVIESLMMGVPAITTAFNGAADFLRPEGGAPRGLVVDDPGDAKALADAMAELADPARRSAMAAAAIGLHDELSMARHVDRLEEVLRRAAAEVPAPATPEPAETPA